MEPKRLIILFGCFLFSSHVISSQSGLVRINVESFHPRGDIPRTDALDLIRFVVIMLFEFPLNCSAAPSAPTGNGITISTNRTPPPR